MATVLISGGNGLLGKHLCNLLQKKGFDVSVLSREKREHATYKTYVWNVEKEEVDEEAILKADYIIHLAGEGIADKRWTDKRKQEIIDSRVKSANLLLKKVKQLKKPIKAFVTASGVGYYGAVTNNKIYSETDSPGNDFLARTCVLWEAAADEFALLGTRVVKIRTGIVLEKNSGFFTKLRLPVKLFCAAVFGNGRQFLPWIHIDDICAIYIKTIEDSEMAGAYNAVAPEHINQKQFTKEMCLAFKRPMLLPTVPTFLLKLIFGEMALIFLTGSRVNSEKILKAGYQFKFTNVKGAINDLVYFFKPK
ncbi:MAG TPA: TIGR01777 family oxidoreductase [Bacteroidia bacterium]|nr:TIGR01777 family oxidoreductase [Bacteroidia bacterium]